MDKETLALVIAQNGLGSAQTLIQIKAATLQKQADAEQNAAAKKKLLARMRKAQKLAAALKAADTGLAEYLAEASAL
ncbi:MAG TPA: hypothetical protein PLD20_12960 [Blastocatellia bacterium]|nr:hypothetical protein [Blastocatellia bacterium]HMV87193.1 hypothetical protein [Blastocatellia bacterium]HMX28613.1 hypothetical protein [Blastocatellia bacterium]HMY70281.1 hypothetical protein [Blastocatellia bacterium]HMZ18838.1 hypothetical protein [Blastocatellia bacterium]